MKNNSFIVKYTPKTLDEFNLEENTYKIINTLMLIDDINIICIGNRDSGKTCFLEILLKEYYGENVNYMENVLYVNNSKEQGIQYYRNDVKSFCQTKSSIFGKKKFVVLDDLDLMNDQSQQVFRNFMDNYKNNVFFIASCTNIQKILETLQSRQYLLHLNNVDDTKMLNMCNKIIENEIINITDEAKSFIIKISNYSLRILMNYLEKIKIYNDHVDLQLSNKLCTNIDFNDFSNYLNHINNENIQHAINILYELYDKGYSVMDILDEFFSYLKLTLLLTNDIKYKIIPYVCKYIHIFHDLHEDEIELSLFTNNLYKLIHNL